MGLFQKLGLHLRQPRPRPRAQDGSRHIFVACPDHAAPAGGVRQIYRLVDTLRSDLQLSASVYHRHTGFRVSWFPSTTPIDYADAVAPREEDFVVLPEVWGNAMKEYPGVRKIIFNQNAYYTFINGYASVPSTALLRPADAGVVGMLTVSEDSAELLRHTFPETPVLRIRYEVDPTLFFYAPDKRAQIAFMPRKHADEARQVLNTLALRGALAGFEIKPIDAVSENESARILRESALFLSFGYPEGFSLPVAEAMACGCLTIGYHGMGAREFFRPEFSWPIETGHILDYVRTVEDVLAAWRKDPDPLRVRAQAASRFILDAYSADAHRRSVRSAWQPILSGEKHER